MIGKTVAHYKILSKLGEGGMGVVYKAEDLKLKRIVALKFLPARVSASEDEVVRFQQEAEAVSALNHPNIATVFDIDDVQGQKFLAMEYIPGGTLKSRLKHLKSEDRDFSIGEALDYGIQAAEALAHAHRHQIIHRDVKTDNLMLTEEGKVKLTDFGLAKLRGSVHLTKTGTTVGTAAYMSPEQIRGEEVDHRSDIFSLGVVLYELATSRLPFRGDFETALSYSILNENPQPASSLRKLVPPELEKVIERCLDKEKSKRYQRTEDIVNSLREIQEQLSPVTKSQKKGANVALLAASALLVVAAIAIAYFLSPAKHIAVAEQSIAVLPFVDLSPEKDQDYFCDGMTDDLIGRLSAIKGLKVPGRSSAFTFKGKPPDMQEVGERLKVQSALEGSVQKSGNRLRITVQLVNIADGYQLWSERYDRDAQDVFAIQDEITLAIAERLRITLLGEQKGHVSKSQTDNPEAYTLYLKGRYFRFRETHEDNQKALSYFQQAIRADSQYALAWAGLANSYFMMDLQSRSKPQHHRQSLAAVTTALELDSTLAEGHVAMGLIRNFYESNWTAAELSYKRAIEVNPREWDAHREYGLLLLRTGRIREALAELQTSVDLDPLSWIANVWLGLCYAQTDNHQMAIGQLKEARQMAVGPTVYDEAVAGELGRMYFLEGSPTKAQEEFKKAGPRYELWYLVRRGERKRALAIVRSMEDAALNPLDRSYSLAHAYACVGENDKALSELDSVLGIKPMALLNITIAPEFEGLRSDPRFVAFLRKMGMRG